MRDINKIKFLTADELGKLFKAIKLRRDRLLFLIAYRHGLRASEVGLLRIEDIDLQSKRIHIRRLKGSLPGLHRLESDELRELRIYLKELGRRSGPLFMGYKSQGISRRAIDLLMKHYCKQSGITSDKAHFHTLKHSIACHLIDAGMGIEHLRDWLGHRNIENTMIYAKLSNAALNDQAERVMAKLPRF